MSYTALYRKFRPDSFGAVRGQEHITSTLINQIRSERIGHAYLFCGTRGTGKTTVAKILARAINCENRQEGEPCGVCPSCQSIMKGACTDVVEMDAASNNSVEDIRKIIEEVAYTPAQCSHRVYIVDEVHMLSKAAENAFLKTLEEPPAHAVFILATTDPQKLLPTIRSRCQRYDFRRMSPEIIAGHMADLLEREGVEADQEALDYIARAADGSMRDGLSLLEQVIAFHADRRLTHDSVLEVLGAVDTTVFSRLLGHILMRDVAACVADVDDILYKGREISQFVTDMTLYLRDLLLSGHGASTLMGLTREGADLLQQDLSRVEEGQLMEYIRDFALLGDRMKYASMKRILLDTTLIRLCHPELGDRPLTTAGQVDTEQGDRPMAPVQGDGPMTPELASTLADLRRRIETLSGQVSLLEKNGTVAPNQPAVSSAGDSRKAPETAVRSLPRAVPEDLKPLLGKWQTIAQGLSAGGRAQLKDASLTLDERGGLLLVFDDSLKLDMFRESGHEQELELLLTDILQKEFDLTLKADESGLDVKRVYPNIFENPNIHMEIESEDE